MSLLSQLSLELRLSRSDIDLLIRSAPRRYKVYQIPKKSGGVRTIAHPAREVKSLQRALIKLSPKKLSVHTSSFAYETGTSILKNANAHAKSAWIARLDFSNFFNSITAEHWGEFLLSRDVDDEYRSISASAFFWRRQQANSLCLSVGAPSSPFVSNRIMFDFDSKISSACEQNKMIYTRYADDITISSSNKLERGELTALVEQAVPAYLTLALNEKKTRISGPGSRKVVTGLIVTDVGKVTIGKSRRKLIESYVHRALTEDQTVSVEELRGFLAFLRHIEPDAYHKLEQKFSERVPHLFGKSGSKD